MKKILPVLIILISVCTAYSQSNETLYEILKNADLHRGGQIKGITWDLVVKNYKNNSLENELDIFVEASTIENNQFALISFLKPKKFADQKLLIRNNSMWFSKKGVDKKIAISGRQRLTGSAANADVGNSNYYIDYEIKSSSETIIDGKKTILFILESKNSMVSYSSLKYWVTVQDHLGIKVEFYGKSEKLIKTATFEYNNNLNDKSKFVSSITIRDNININDYTVLTFSNIKLTNFNMLKFDK